MSNRILVADDSSTIQKVISITLADTEYDLDQCLSDEDLMKKVKKNSYSLILLDVNLSEVKSGYDLATEIKSFAPSTPVFLMLGTFDTIDLEKCESAGIDDYITKPFESSKFIHKCHTLIENGQTSQGQELEIEESFTELKVDDFEINNNEGDTQEEGEEELDEWIVDAPKQVYSSSEDDTSDINTNQSLAIKSFLSDSLDDEEGITNSSKQDHTDSFSSLSSQENLDSTESVYQNLNEEIQDWGMRAPAVIGENDKSQVEFPPVIEEKSEESSADSIEFDFETVQGDSRKDEPADVEDDVSKEIDFEMSSNDDKPPHEEAIHFKLEEMEEREAPEESEENDNFWSADDEEDLDDQSVEEELNEIRMQPDSPKEEKSFVLEKPVTNIEMTSTDLSSSVDLEALSDLIIQKMRPEIEKRLDEKIEQVAKTLSQEQIERVAWEIIPDLAENLIKKEIKEISDSIST